MRLALLVPVLAGCTASAGDPMPDFALDDVNPNSKTFERTVDVVDYQGVATAWYFTHST